MYKLSFIRAINYYNKLTLWFMYQLLDALLAKNEVIDTIKLDGPLNLHWNAFKDSLKGYQRSGKGQEEAVIKKRSGQIKVKYGNLILILNIIY